MAINHRKGFKSAEEAERSKAFRMTPGATIETGCSCGQVHVNMMGSAMSADRPPADQVHSGSRQDSSARPEQLQTRNYTRHLPCMCAVRNRGR